MNRLNLDQSVAPTEEPVSLADLKTHVRVCSDADDAYLSDCIAAARAYAEAYTRRQFVTATWVYKFRRFADRILIPKPEAIAITSFTYLDVDSASQTVSSSIYTLHATTSPGTIERNPGQSWPGTDTSDFPITLTYTAGYGAASAVPADITRAIKMLAAFYFENREAATDMRSMEVPFGVHALLRPHRVEFPEWA